MKKDRTETKVNQFSEELIIRFFNGKLDKDEIRELQEWINSSKENLAEFEAYRKIWLGTAIHLSNDKFDPQAAWEKTASRIHFNESSKGFIYTFRNNKRLQKILQIAAMFILFASVGAVGSWFIFSSKSIQFMNQSCEIVTPQGSKSQITLPDGSIAWINAGSKLSYAGEFNQAERVVNLQGEAYFNVKSNKEKPFVVQTSYLKVKAYGTVFNVKAYPEEKTIVTTLVEGNVVVEAKDNANKTYSYTLKPKQNMIYHIKTGLSELPGEKITKKESLKLEKAEIGKEVVRVINDIKPELYTSWKDENWVIEGIPLGSLATIMERRFNTKIEIQNDVLKLYKFTGTIRNETLEQVLVILRLTTPLEYQVGKGSVTWQLDKKLEKQYSRLLKR
ncbi:MAG: FecR family protein [Bacteroidales bacterium]